MNKIVVLIATIVFVAVGSTLFFILHKPTFPQQSTDTLTPTFTPKNLTVSMNLQDVHSSPALGGKSGIEIVVWASNGFPVRNEIAVLYIGSKEFTLNRYTENGDTHTLIFTLTPEEFAQTATGDLVTVQYGHDGESNEQWNFGPLDKSLLDKKNVTTKSASTEPAELTGHAPTPTPEKAPQKALDIGALKTLADRRGIRIGALYQSDLRNTDVRGELYDQTFAHELNALTIGSFWGPGYRPSRNEYVFAPLDEIVNWGLAHDMELYVQTLVWYSDMDGDGIPDWVKATPNAEVEAVMNEHIDTMVGRYKGKIKAWNVVNEACNDGDSGTLRQGHKWFEAMGDDYIRKAFVRAHAADPGAVLYYNDYDIESNQPKFTCVKNLLVNLKNQNTPVDALGWQMHVKPGSFDSATLLARMNEIANLGFDNYITELDVELPVNATAIDYEQQKQTYKTIVQTFMAARRHRVIIVWGLRDVRSGDVVGDYFFLTNNHPLLFDENYNKKPAYFGVQEALE